MHFTPNSYPGITYLYSVQRSLAVLIAWFRLNYGKWIKVTKNGSQ